MFKLFIDSKEIESAICEDLKIGLRVEQVTSPEEIVKGQSIRLRILATPANRAAMCHTDQIFSAERFNDTEHYGRIEVQSFIVYEGNLFLESVISNSAGAQFYVAVLKPQTERWKHHSAKALMKDIAIEYQAELTDAVIRDSWSNPVPFAFLPVQRDRFKFQFDISSSTPIMALTIENYHPFINIAAALRAIAAESGYTIESKFFESGFFQSLYMSGNYPSTNSELLKSRMAFNAGRLSDSAVLSVEADQWIFANPSRSTGANVGNIVESADSHDDITFYNNGGCFQMLDGKIVFVPSEQAVIGFEYELRYECGFTVESVERLRTYDTVCLDDGLTYSFTVPNTVPVLNNSTHFKGTMILRCSLVADYKVRMRITYESGTVELLSVNYDYVYLSRSEYIDSVGVEISTNGTSYTHVTDGWALYDSADYNGVVQVCVKLRSQPKLRSAGEIIRFDGIYFSGYDSATTFRLLSTTRLRPIFGESPSVGSKISTETLMAHDGVYQSALFGAVAQMFNLRFYTDRICRKILIEPYDAFYASGSTVDWREKQDPNSEITISEAGDSLNRTMTYLYQDGDGAVARWNEDNKKKFARWRVEVQNRLADEGESVELNPLFTPTRGNASVVPSAQSAHLINVGDRLRYGVPNDGDMFVAPKVVRYLGMCPLLTGERWGWPAGITSYPLAAFHLTGLSGNVDSEYNSVLCDDSDVLVQKGMTLCFDDYEGQRGLHQFYDNMYRQINSGRILKMNIRLTPADVEMLSMPNEVADLRSTFLLEVGGETLKCRLLEVEPFDPRQNKSTQCTFFVIN
ncbi:MAG: hypothetical protein J6U99_04195 [Rikenellaceae bacterium]|nr:hypothetical protein [Rikenellaceae bacterium]